MVDSPSEVAIRCPALGRVVRATVGQTLFEALRAAGVPVASACRGEGICGRCGLEVLEGGLPPPDPVERACAARNRVPPGLRLSCRVVLTGGLVVRAPYW